MKRRRFVKMVTFGTATSVVAGKLWQRELLAYCEPSPGLKEAVFKVRISEYPALANAWGSVRLGVNPVLQDTQPFPNGDFYPFLINRDDGGNFYVLDCECAHQSCVVPTFDSSQLNITCPCHGSQYWVDGSLLNGPAQAPLHTYPFDYDGNDTLTIHISCWGFETTLGVLPGGTRSRVKIDFATHPQISYQVFFSSSSSGPWSVVSFATTPTGPANQTSLITSGGDATVYVDRTLAAGYYSVGMKLTPV